MKKHLLIYLIIYSIFVFVILRHFTDISPYLQIDEDSPLPCIDAPFQDSGGSDITQVQPFFFRKIFL